MERTQRKYANSRDARVAAYKKTPFDKEEKLRITFDFDKVRFSKLKGLLGEMAALPIDDYIVIYNPAKQDNILIAKAI